MSIKSIRVFSAEPKIQDGKLLAGTDVDGIVQLDTEVTTGYKILGYTIYTGGTPALDIYCEGVYLNKGQYRFKRTANYYGFIIDAICVKF